MAKVVLVAQAIVKAKAVYIRIRCESIGMIEWSDISNELFIAKSARILSISPV
jgi:hypothetical protein